MPSVLYILVIYGREAAEAEAMRTLFAGHEERLQHLFIYDNSPSPHTPPQGIAHYVHDPSNGGLGRAYNTACRYAETKGYEWLLLLDQDTTFPPDAIDKYESAMATHPETDMIAPRHMVNGGKYLSPTHYRMKTSHLQNSTPTGTVAFKDACPINSGLLVTVKSFIKAGGYDEPVWLDFSDIRFIEKYRKHYNTFYVMPDLVCQQSYSGLDTDPEKVFQRFCIYLQCAAAYPRDSWTDTLALTVTTLRPTLSHTIRQRTLRYLKAYFKSGIVHC